MNNRLLVFTFIFLSSFVVAKEIAWQQTLGSAGEEYLFDAISTYNYGVLLAGSSVFEASGNKKDGNQGGLDYLLWKMIEDGKLEWQKNYGGAGNDYLYTVAYTKDGEIYWAALPTRLKVMIKKPTALANATTGL